MATAISRDILNKETNARFDSKRLNDLTAQRFGRLIVVARASSTSYGATRWKVRCDDPCGREIIVFSTGLARGETKSCGCVRSTTHGQTGGRGGKPSGAYRAWHSMLQRCTNPNTAGRRGAYVSWQHMLQRCTNPETRSYEYYGGRGICVCERWLSFENFYTDMGDRPIGTSISRKRVDGNYEPTNCCWESLVTQARNTRASVLTFESVQEILGRFEYGESRASIGRRLGIAPTYVGAIIKGKAWTEVARPHLNKVLHD